MIGAPIGGFLSKLKRYDALMTPAFYAGVNLARNDSKVFGASLVLFSIGVSHSTSICRINQPPIKSKPLVNLVVCEALQGPVTNRISRCTECFSLAYYARLPVNR